ncbi:MAG TPA: tetratricopeptide repeat protein [Gemmatimonadaceae bacterium]
MADVTRLKKKAAEFEAKRQYDRAIAVYEQIAIETTTVREGDIPLFNRLGDLYLRVGDVERASVLHERAVDMYAELGFFNNAIALCNKILRQAPGRVSVYYKLGKISAKKGFISDAKQNFLEYSARMQKAGKIDEAFRALKEFADLCPDQDDVRLMLAEQLNRAGRSTDAVEQLQILHEQFESEGRDAEAAATVERMRAIDPHVEPRRATGPAKRGGNDLIFLDLNEGFERPPRTTPVSGLMRTSLVDDKPPADLHVLTPQEFAAIELPDAAAEGDGTSATVRADLPVLDSDDVAPAEGDVFGSDHALADLARHADATAAEESDDAGVFSRYDDGYAEQAVDAPIYPDVAEAGMADASGSEDDAAEDPVTGIPEDAWAARAAVPEEQAAQPAEPVSGTDAAEEDYVDLGAWLREMETPRSTRMVADAGEIPPEGEQADFDEMLEKFKHGLAQNMDADDYGSHYDLGIAFREMGLLDEAIAEFQKALRGREHRVATYEALGQCFVDKRQYEVAVTVLQRALREPGFEDERGLGVLYLLGLANERMVRHAEAARYYQRVFSVDINFRDITDRLSAVAQAAG